MTRWGDNEAGDTARNTNGYDRVSFVLQLTQLGPLIAGALNTFISDEWAIESATLLLTAAWTTSPVLLSRLANTHLTRWSRVCAFCGWRPRAGTRRRAAGDPR